MAVNSGRLIKFYVYFPDTKSEIYMNAANIGDVYQRLADKPGIHIEIFGVGSIKIADDTNRPHSHLCPQHPDGPHNKCYCDLMAKILAKVDLAVKLPRLKVEEIIEAATLGKIVISCV